MSANKELIKFLQEQGDSMLPDGSMTHWEALAQAVWKKALGFEVKNEKGEILEYVVPDKASIGQLFDHMVGKPKAVPLPKKSEKKADKVPLSQRVGDSLAVHVKEQGEKDADTGGQDKARSKGSLSKRVRDMALRRNRDRSSQEPDQESGVATEDTGRR